MKNTILFIALIFLNGCIYDQGKVLVDVKQKAPSLSNIQVASNQFIINGNNLESVSALKMSSGGSSIDLAIESKSTNKIVANALGQVTFAAGAAFDLLLSSANAAATFSVNFSLCDSSLNGKGFNCTLTPADKDILTFDSSTNKWIPSTAPFTEGSGNLYKATGFIGMGTTSPFGKIHLNGADENVQMFISNTDSTVERHPSLVIYNFDGSGYSGFPRISMRGGRGSMGAQIASQAGDGLGQLEFQANRGGNWTTPARITAYAGEAQTNSNRGGAIGFDTVVNGSTTLVERMRITNNGNVGIGTATATAPLTVSTTAVTGNIATFASTGAGGAGCSISWNGTSCSSDIRLKENVENLTGAFDDIFKLQAVKFVWKKDPKKQKQIGFIAQDVEKVFPEVVKNDDLGFKQVNYANLVAVAIEAIKEFYSEWGKDKKELQRELASMKEKAALQDQKINELNSRLEKLERANTRE